MGNVLRKSEDETIFPAPRSEDAWIASASEYARLYQHSTSSPDAFWAEQAEQHIDWIEKWSVVRDCRFGSDDTQIHWYKGAKLNVCYNCVDRHLPERAEQTAIIWEGNEPDSSEYITYAQLYREVCRFANVLKSLGIKKGDVVTIYMPMIPEAAYAMLACARIGAVHSVVFGGFSPEALRNRIDNCGSKLVVTADESLRGSKRIALKSNVDEALKGLGSDVKSLVVRNSGASVNWEVERDTWYHEIAATVSDECDIEVMDAEDTLFVLYTSGSTGKPKGVQHSCGGYIVYATITHKYIFDYHDGDVYWCTADIGWITGHSYIVYAPLANGATTLMFEGVPTYPTASRFWDIVDKHRVTQFYTAPTAIRALMALGDEHVKSSSRTSLRILGSVGEPINPEAWRWYYEVVGNSRCPIVDTWWQTETGGIMLSPLPYATDLKAGCATVPFFGVQPVILDPETGEELHGECEGALCFKESWPGQMRTVIGDHQRFIDTYFSQYDGYYFSGDGCRRDADGYYWITGRMDDVLNVSGHRIGTAEVESALVAHKDVAEAAVVGYPHPIKGQGIYVYVTLNKGVEHDDALREELIALVGREIGSFAKPDYLQFAEALPKTRSGKIMRRILRKIAENDFETLGDTSTLLNPEIVDRLIEGRLIK